MVETVTASRLRDRIDAAETFTLLDTRPEESYEAWHVPGAVQYTYDPDAEFDAGAFRSRTGLTPDDEIVTVVEDGMEGWSEVYDVVEIPTAADVEIVQFQRRAKGCLSYLIGDPASRWRPSSIRHDTSNG